MQIKANEKVTEKLCGVKNEFLELVSYSPEQLKSGETCWCKNYL